MPILDVDKARTVMVIKRSMAAGFAGIDNPLYYLDKTLMLFGDAKNFVSNIVRELTGGSGTDPVAAIAFQIAGFRLNRTHSATFVTNSPHRVHVHPPTSLQRIFFDVGANRVPVRSRPMLSRDHPINVKTFSIDRSIFLPRPISKSSLSSPTPTISNASLQHS